MKLYNNLKNTFMGKIKIPENISTEVYQRPYISKRNKSRIVAIVIRFLRKIKRITRRDRVRNLTTVDQLDIKLIG